MISWRIRRVCRVGDNKELAESIQSAVDDYLEDIPVTYQIDGDIDPEWSTEWGLYPGIVPVIGFDDVITDKTQVDRLMEVVDALSSRHLYVSSWGDVEIDKDQTTVLVRIDPVYPGEKSFYYLVVKGVNDEERCHVYRKNHDDISYTYGERYPRENPL